MLIKFVLVFHFFLLSVLCLMHTYDPPKKKFKLNHTLKYVYNSLQ